MKLYIKSPDDRDSVVAILARNGYTVRQGKERREANGRSIAYVEYCAEPIPMEEARRKGGKNNDTD